MDPQPQLNITPYTVIVAIITVLSILASDAASGTIPANVQSIFNLSAIVLSALTTVLFARATPAVRHAAASVRSKFHK